MTVATSLMPLTTTDLLTGAELSGAELRQLFVTAESMKHDYSSFRDALAGTSIVMLFEKPSLRTRVSFEIGMRKLGGDAIYLDHQGTLIGEREPIADYARNLERWTDVIVARTFAHDTVLALAEHAEAPVINALCDTYHPCQALADLFTLFERIPDLPTIKLAWVGDGNNVCHSLMLVTAAVGAHLTVITPPGHEPDADISARAAAVAAATGATVSLTNDINAVEHHDAVYTDTWVSMGREGTPTTALEPYQVNAEVMSLAGADAIFMHCLPAHRGQEVSAEVIDAPCSVIYDQAENRMHIQNAVLLHLLKGG